MMPSRVRDCFSTNIAALYSMFALCTKGSYSFNIVGDNVRMALCSYVQSHLTARSSSIRGLLATPFADSILYHLKFQSSACFVTNLFIYFVVFAFFVL